MSCLGDVVAALVDGELEHAARERAQRHLARCTPCRSEVDVQRRLKARLTGATVGEPKPSDALTARLLGLRPAPARTAPTAAVAADVVAPGVLAPSVLAPGVLAPSVLAPGVLAPGVLRPDVLSRDSVMRDAGTTVGWRLQPRSQVVPRRLTRPQASRSAAAGLCERRVRRGRRRGVVVGSALAVLGAALVLGGPQPVAPPTPVDPGTDAFVADLVGTTSGTPIGTTTGTGTAGAVGGGRSQR